jgi:regulator of sigma E protease
MSIIIFIIILLVLVVVHEFGHYIVAKKNGIRVDEFGFGYPPKAMKLFRKWDTDFTLNWIPFGGFVKIYGEDPNDENTHGPDSHRAMVNKPARVQAAVLVAGVVFNLILAWILLSVGFMTGLPSTVTNDEMGKYVQNPELTITQVMKESPASEGGLQLGDVIVGAKTDTRVLSDFTQSGLISFVSTSSTGEEITFTLNRKGETIEESVVAREGVVEGKRAIGVSSDLIGTLKLPIHKALLEGTKQTWNMTKGTAVSLAVLVRDAFIGKADVNTLSGPVGIVGIVGDAADFGFVYLMSFTALISINLAIINLIPFPALDGGRLLFLLIEKIKGSRISPRISNSLNTVGFFILIALMLVVTYHDIAKLV